jgi:hypothetical protein
VEAMADTAATSDTVDGEDMVGLVVMVETAAMVDTADMVDTAAMVDTADMVDTAAMVDTADMVDTAAMVDPVITNKMAATVVMEVKVLAVAMSRLVKVFIDTNIFFIKDLMRYGPNIVHCMHDDIRNHQQFNTQTTNTCCITKF